LGVIFNFGEELNLQNRGEPTKQGGLLIGATAEKEQRAKKVIIKRRGMGRGSSLRKAELGGKGGSVLLEQTVGPHLKGAGGGKERRAWGKSGPIKGQQKGRASLKRKTDNSIGKGYSVLTDTPSAEENKKN